MTFSSIVSRKYRGYFKRLVKLAIGLVVYAFDEAARLVKRAIGVGPSGATIAIYYHQVSRANRVRFARQMDHLLRWATPVRAERVALSDGNALRRVAVTADDGWKSFVDNALPELEQRNIPSTLFVVSHLLGDKLCDSENADDLNDRLISEAELTGLRRELVTIGSHTATHARLTHLPATDVRRELRDSRLCLSRLLRTDVDLICFPFSDYDEKTLAMSRSAGYAQAFGSQTTPLSEPHDSFLVERVRVDPTDWPIEFHLKLMNAYRLVFCAARLKQHVQTALSGLNSAPADRIGRLRGEVATGRYSDASKQ